ncbi:MAG: DegT/DnrJ/EryC1/StrS family aminotransferase [Longimicrobiales bacterium]
MVKPAPAIARSAALEAPRGTRRTQLPVYSPLSIGALARATMMAFTPGADPCAALSALLAREYGADGVLLTDSGTHALQLAIRAGLASCDAPVAALPAFTCYDVATAAVGAGAGIVVYDIDPATLAPDPDSLEAALKRGARTVVVSPLYGIPVDWEAIESLAEAFGALVIEDAAQGHGATWRGRALGSHGRLSVLSFGRGKGWTGGAGGALLWRRNEPAPRFTVPASTIPSGIRTLVNAAAQWALGRPALYHLPASLPWLDLGETLYRTPSPTRTLRGAIAALALATHAASLSEAVTRREHAALLLERLRDDAARIRVPANGAAGYLRLPVRVRGDRGRAVAANLHHLGVAASYPSTLAQLPAVRSRRAAGSDDCLPGADALVRELITLPTHSLLSDADLQGLMSSLATALHD